MKDFIPWGFYYFSKSHIRSAALFAREAKRIEDETDKDDFLIAGGLELEEHSSYIISSIIMTVAYLEAFINEVFTLLDYEATEHYAQSFIKTADMEKREKISKLWKMQIPKTAKFGILQKYDFLLINLTNQQFIKSEKVYQNIDTLIKLRNYFVHYEPEQIQQPTGKNNKVKIANIGKKLKGKFRLNPKVADSAPFFPDKCLSYGCAYWGISNALSFTEDFAKKICWSAFNSHRRKSVEDILGENFT